MHEESPQSTLTTDVLIDLVNDAKSKIANKKVFTNAIRDEIRSYQFEISKESKEFEDLQMICEGLTKNGNAEKFYSKYYATIALQATKYFPGLSRNSATLLSTKLADRLLAHSKEVQLSPNPADDEVEKSLQEKEMAGLQYLGGYVLQKLHNKHRTSKNWKTSESQQAISALKACKEESKNAIESQKLVTSLNHGGLWSPTRKAQTIFLKAEHYFRETCKPGQCQRSTNIHDAIEKSCKDPDVVSSFNAIVSEASLKIENSVCKDMLHSIINLYVRVRSFSFARDIIHKHKIKQKQVKAKALRKEIQRASVDNEERQS